MALGGGGEIVKCFFAARKGTLFQLLKDQLNVYDHAN